MQYPGYTRGAILLTEGNSYVFKIHNLIQLQDNEYYYVLIDVNGLKHFLTAKYYKNYKFSSGDDIICSVDKINCTGRIYLEPVHPYYKEDTIYLFDLEIYENRAEEQSIIVTDIYGNKIPITSIETEKQWLIMKKRVKCRIKNIKKGVPELEIVL